jgi:uncharacterized delta-60 repeat protein
VCDWPPADYKDGRLIVGTNVFDQTTNLIATLNLTVPPAPFGPRPVQAMLVQNDGRILVGGAFESINGDPQAFLARLVTETNSTAPVIMFQPINQRVFAGQAVSFSLQVASMEPVTFQWRHQGLPLVGATHSSLVISNAQSADAGSYDVLVRNASGEVLSEAVSLVVAGTDLPVISTEPADAHVDEGGIASFTVGVTNAIPSYQWQWNGSSVPGETNATLLITPVLRSHAGEYRAVVTAGFGAVTSKIATLTVTLNPQPAGTHDISFFPGPDIDGPVDSVAVGSDGKIYLSGAFTQRVQGKSRYLAARLHADGSVDDTFVLERSRTPGSWARVLQVVPAPDGSAVLKVRSNQIIACGGPCSYVPVFLAKVNKDGSADLSFPQVSSFVNALAADREGRLLVGSDGPVLRGSAEPGSLRRLSFDGKVDTGFSVTEFRGAPSPGFLTPALLSGVVEMPDGRIIVAGNYAVGEDFRGQSLTRYFPDGRLDTSFSSPLVLPLFPDAATQTGSAMLALNRMDGWCSTGRPACSRESTRMGNWTPALSRRPILPVSLASPMTVSLCVGLFPACRASPERGLRGFTLTALSIRPSIPCCLRTAQSPPWRSASQTKSLSPLATSAAEERCCCSIPERSWLSE